MKTNARLLILIIAFGLFTPSLIFCQDYEAEPVEELLPTLFNQFYTGTDDIVELKVETNMRQWIKKKFKEEYQKAKLSYTDKSGKFVEHDIKIRPRGNIRKQICYFPPLKFKFRKLDLEEESLLTDFNDFKMVNQCKSAKDNGEYIFREYMAYKLYNLVSPYSHRAQLISVEYIDIEGKSKPQKLYGFIIEPHKEMAKRVGGVHIKRKKSASVHVERDPYLLMTLFQYMIANTDWALANMHNMKLIKVPEHPKMLPVPYDFDYSGFVDTHYAVPFEGLPIKSVKQRLYRGNGCTPEEAEKMVEHFKAQKESILNYCEQFPHLEGKVKKGLMKFMDEFFEVLESSKKVKNNFKVSKAK